MNPADNAATSNTQNPKEGHRHMQHPHGLNMDTRPPKPKRQPPTFADILARIIVATIVLAGLAVILLFVGRLAVLLY